MEAATPGTVGMLPGPHVDANGMAQSPVRNLLPHHYAELRRSGLTAETIQAAGIYSETAATKVAALLDSKNFPPRCLPAMVFPFRNSDGRNGYCRIRPDHPRTSGGKPVKYESPRGQPNQVYLPPRVAEVLSDPTCELLITEGERKALAAMQAGFPCIGLVGVFGWKQGNKETLLPALERIAWHGRNVRIVFDSDIADKPEVQDAENRLAAHLTNRGAIVKAVRIPPGKPGANGKPEKVGLDDFLVSAVAKGLNPAGELRRLLDHAEDPKPPEGGQLKQRASEIDAVPEAAAFLAATERDGVPQLRFHRGGWWNYRAGAYREMQPSEVRGELVDYLDKRYYRLTQAAINNVLDGLKAKARLPHHIEAPAWIGDTAPAWDSADILVCRNGMIHLPTFTARNPDHQRPATPRLFATTVLDYDFRADAPRPDTWYRFLGDLLPDDPESLETLQDWFGYCLTPDTRQQKILLLIGPKRSGKGTIARVLRAVIGPENTAGPTLSSLATPFGLWPLLGKSLATISDARLSGRTDSSIVVERLLSISGEDALTVDRKCLEPVTCKLPTRLMILSNELPRLGDASGALSSRMILLHLTKSFYGHEDHELTDRLLSELPGVLLWAIEGWRRLRERRRFVQPRSSADALGALYELSSPINEFVRTCCLVGEEYSVPRADLYTAYKKWAEERGRKNVEDSAGFGRFLRAAVPTIRGSHPRVDGGRERLYVGIDLTNGTGGTRSNGEDATQDF